MKRVLYFLYFIASVLVFTSCQREIDWSLPKTDPNNPDATSPLKASVIGLIVDENNQPFPGVVIKSGSVNSAITDSRGYFRFNNITLDKYKSLITAEKTGYFKGYRVFSASNKGTNFIKIQLLKKISAGIVSGTTGGSVITGSNSITLPASAVVVKATGIPYTGNVTIFMQPIDPTASNISSIVPGSFLAIDSNNRQGLLSSFAMMAVELEGAAGEPLQLAAGKIATISFAIPTSLQLSAPDLLPLWYLDETTGIWKQEGNAVKNGNVYTGNVKHFSSWNCDVWRGPLIYLEMTIKDMSGIPIPYALIRVRSQSVPSAMASGPADSLGHFSGLVPANESLELNVLNDCYSSAYTRILQPMSQQTNIGDIRIDPGASGISISGTVKNCSGQPVSNGSAYIYLDEKLYFFQLSASGQFNTTLLHCQNNVEIVVYDVAASQGNTYQFTIGIDNVSNLQLVACGGTNYIVTTVTGTTTAGYFDGPLNSAQFSLLFDICFDQAGNLYLSDYNNNRIRKITPAGIVSTFAGDGTAGFADGPGATAKFNGPRGLTIDQVGNIYVCEFLNYRIRMITPAGVVSTYAGNGTPGFANGPVASATFNGLSSITSDPAGNLYVTEGPLSFIRKITPLGIVSTYAGNGSGFADGPAASAKFNQPTGITSDAAGNLFVADALNHRIRMISTSGMVSTIAGSGVVGSSDGPAVLATFDQPTGIALDANGNILVSDQNSYRIRKIDASGNVTTIAGNSGRGYADGLAASAQFYHPLKIKVAPNGVFYITDQNRLRKLSQ